MTSPFLQKLEAGHFGCLGEVAIELTPIHALIGPNDSGKSTILRATRVAMDLLAQSAKTDNPYGTVRQAPVFDLTSSGLETDRLQRLAVSCGDVSLEISGLGQNEWISVLTVGNETASQRVRGLLDTRDLYRRISAFDAIRKGPSFDRVFGGARLLRLDPDALRESSTLIPDTEPVRLLDERGRGLAGVYDKIVNRGDDSFRQIVEDVRRLFPTVAALRLRNVSASTKALELELRHGERVPARFISEGLLYYLAFAAVRYLEPAAILLVEEPENGLHPVRIAEVMRALREISKTTQVLIATHSPLVVNELSPDEVSLVTRDAERGSSTRRLSNTQDFSERSKVYAAGELWLSYANGDDESALLGPPKQ